MQALIDSLEAPWKIAKDKKKSAMKMKKSAMKEKMNMVKGPDGKMVPDFAVDGKGAGDMKKSAAKMMKKSPAKQGMKKMTAADKKKLQALSEILTGLALKSDKNSLK